MPKALTLDILSKLIGFDTTSANSNLELMNFTGNCLKEHGVDSQLVYNQEQSKANLYATIGPAGRAGVMLSGQTVDFRALAHEGMTLVGLTESFDNGVATQRKYIAYKGPR